MKTFWLVWLGGCAGIVCWYGFRYALLARRIRRTDAQLHSRIDAMRRVNERFLADLYTPAKPRVEAWLFPTPLGGEIRWKVRGINEEECAEVVSQSEWFRPSTEDAA